MKTKMICPSQSIPQPKVLVAGVVAICLTGILLGTIPLFKGILIWKFNCSSIAFFRVSVGFLSISLFILISYLRNGQVECFLIQRKHICSFIGYGAISIAAVNYFYLKSLTCTSTAIAVVTVFVAAPLTTLLASFFTGGARDKKEMFYILFIVFGCILVNMQTTASGIRWDGLIYATMAGVCYGLFSIFGKSIAEDYDYPVMMFWQFLIASVTTFMAMVFLGGNVLEIFSLAQAITSKEIIAIIGIGVFSTFIPYLLYSYGLKKGVPPTTASALTLLEPISGTIIAFAFLDEGVTLLQGIGILIVIFFSGRLATNKKNAQPSKENLYKSAVLEEEGVL